MQWVQYPIAPCCEYKDPKAPCSGCRDPINTRCGYRDPIAPHSGCRDPKAPSYGRSTPHIPTGPPGLGGDLPAPNQHRLGTNTGDGVPEPIPMDPPDPTVGFWPPFACCHPTPSWGGREEEARGLPSPPALPGAEGWGREQEAAVGPTNPLFPPQGDRGTPAVGLAAPYPPHPTPAPCHGAAGLSPGWPHPALASASIGFLNELVRQPLALTTSSFGGR